MDSKRGPVRVTLNLDPAVYMDIQEWCIDAARRVGRPRVSVQDALRAMVTASLDDATAATRQLKKAGQA